MHTVEIFKKAYAAYINGTKYEITSETTIQRKAGIDFDFTDTYYKLLQDDQEVYVDHDPCRNPNIKHGMELAILNHICDSRRDPRHPLHDNPNAKVQDFREFLDKLRASKF